MMEAVVPQPQLYGHDTATLQQSKPRLVNLYFVYPDFRTKRFVIQ
jgi:hypothetical protein